MKTIRVLVIDDSVVVRRLITDVVATVDDLEVVGTAANGRIGLAKIQQLRPDVVTLDLEMPEMGGLETVIQIRKVYPLLPIIMFSSQTERGAAITLEALACGATDYVAKPMNTTGMEDAADRIRAELVPKIRAHFGITTSSIIQPTKLPSRTIFPTRIDAIAIGCSTGGPNALPIVLNELPKTLPVPVFIVQHMPPFFTRQLASNLRKSTGLNVEEARDGAVVEAGQVWVAAGNYHMIVHRSDGAIRLRLTQDPPEQGCRPAVDPLFRSISNVYKSNTLGVILTGMGKDGTNGAQAIHAANGRVFAQDEMTSVVWGMPKSAVHSGVVELTLPLDRIGAEMVSRLRYGRMFLEPTAVNV